MKLRKIIASFTAVSLASAWLVGTPVIAQTVGSDASDVDDTGLWLMGGFIIGEAILVAILTSDDDVAPENPPVSP